MVSTSHKWRWAVELSTFEDEAMFANLMLVNSQRPYAVPSARLMLLQHQTAGVYLFAQ